MQVNGVVYSIEKSRVMIHNNSTQVLGGGYKIKVQN
jgi:hypothetical protein